MSSKSEDIILQLSNVRYKKNNGSLYLSSKRIGWMMDNEDTFHINIQYTDIKNQKVSPEGKPKVQLQLVLNDQMTHTFHFTNPEGKEKQVAERNKVKEKLTQLIIQNKRKPPDELMEKKRVLEENPHLKELYVALVRTEILSPDDFWKEIAGQYKQALGPTLDVGVSGAFLADIKPQTDGSNGRVLYNITPEIMVAIFKTYPAVKKKHEEYVPHQMSEAEFWTRFFQSHYYSVHTTSRSENVFSECAKYDDKEWMRDICTIQNDPLCNLNDIYEDKPLEMESDLKVAGVKAGSNHIHATMIKRFNQHSLNILKAQTASEKEKMCEEMLAKNPDAIANGDAEPELNLTKNKKIRLDEKLHYEDLEKVSKENKPSLVIHQRKRYLAGPSPDLILDEIRPEELPAMHHRLSCIVRSWQPDLHSSQSPSSAFGVLQSLSEASRRGRSNPTSNAGNVLPRDLHSELGKVYSSAGELFRHFWSCFPPRTPQLKEKLHRMHTTLCKYHETTVREFQEMAIREYNRKNNILEHLQDMFQIANSKYEHWKSRNVRRNGIRGKVK
ncbi:UNVERIFIED_CONTAM: hypothetical protein RMT77_017745 [Armadillidium vulgare]